MHLKLCIYSFPWFQNSVFLVSREKSFCFLLLLHFASKFCGILWILYKTHNLSRSVQANKCHFPFKTLLNFPDVSAWHQLVTYASRFHKAACLGCASSALSGAHYVLSPWQAREGLVSRALSLPPNPGAHKGTKAVPLQEASGLCWAAQSCLQDLWMAAAVSLGWHSTGFSSPVSFSCVLFIYSWLLLPLQHWVLGLSLLPEMWSSLKCPWVLVSALFLSGSPGFPPRATVIHEGIPRVLCHDNFLLDWKIIQTTQKFHKNMLISYGEFYKEKELADIHKN